MYNRTMRADQTSITKRVNLASNPESLKLQILRFVKGIRGPRTTEVTLRQIQKWHCGTPKEAVAHEVNELVYEGKLNIMRSGPRGRCQYFYEVVG